MWSTLPHAHGWIRNDGYDDDDYNDVFNDDDVNDVAQSLTYVLPTTETPNHHYHQWCTSGLKRTNADLSTRSANDGPKHELAYDEHGNLRAYDVSSSGAYD
jgi:hypothetical protein